MNRYQAAWVLKYCKTKRNRGTIIYKGTCDFCGNTASVRRISVGKGFLDGGKVKELLICTDCFNEATGMSQEAGVIRSVMEKD